MKLNPYLHFTTLLFFMLCCFSFSSFAQGIDTAWVTHGNHIIDTSNYIGTNNYQDFKIKTDSITRLTITKDGDINFNGNIQMPNKSLQVDSIRTKILHVGDSSILIGTTAAAGTIATGNNFIRVDNHNPICFGYALGTNGLNANFPGVNIGTTTRTYMLHIHDDGTGHSTVNNGCYAHFTNNFTGNSTGNGFLVGIDDNPGNAYLIQRNPLDIKFYTNNTFRAIIKGNNTISTIGGDNTGFVGIGNNAPMCSDSYPS